MKKKLFVFVFMAVMLVITAGCGSGIQVNMPATNWAAGNIQMNAPGMNPLINVANQSGHVAGLMGGIWHGIISPVTMVLAFFNTDTQMYEVHNDGNQYNLGFFLGMVLVFMLLGGLAGSRR